MESHLLPTDTMVIYEDLGCMVRTCQRLCQCVNILFLLQHFPDPYPSMGKRGTPLPRGTWNLVTIPWEHEQ